MVGLSVVAFIVGFKVGGSPTEFPNHGVCVARVC